MCEIAWYAHNAGAQGRMTELMYKPGASTGNCAQHLKRALGLDHETESLNTVCACQPRTSTIRTALSWISPSSQLMKLCIENSRNSQNWPLLLTPSLDLLSGRQRTSRTLSLLVVMASSTLLLCTWMPFPTSKKTQSWGSPCTTC